MTISEAMAIVYLIEKGVAHFEYMDGYEVLVDNETKETIQAWEV